MLTADDGPQRPPIGTDQVLNRPKTEQTQLNRSQRKSDAEVFAFRAMSRKRKKMDHHERVDVAQDIGQVIDLDSERLDRLRRLSAQQHFIEARQAIQAAKSRKEQA